jgi:nitrate reductase NapE component
MYWSKAQGTLTYGMVSIGIITLGCLVFILMDEKLNWKLDYFVAFGMNPLLSYLVAELLYQLPGKLIDSPVMDTLWMKFIIMGAIIVIVSLINWLLWRKKKRVRTEWVTFAFLILIVALSFVI